MVGEAAIVEDAVIGPRAQIGAGARIGSGAVVGPGVTIAAGASVEAGERVFPEGARVEPRRLMSRYEEMFTLVGQLGAQLREGYAAGHTRLGTAAVAPPSTATSARSAARRSGATWPRRCGATRRARRRS